MPRVKNTPVQAPQLRASIVNSNPLDPTFWEVPDLLNKPAYFSQPRLNWLGDTAQWCLFVANLTQGLEGTAGERELLRRLGYAVYSRKGEDHVRRSRDPRPRCPQKRKAEEEAAREFETIDLTGAETPAKEEAVVEPPPSPTKTERPSVRRKLEFSPGDYNQ